MDIKKLAKDYHTHREVLTEADIETLLQGVYQQGMEDKASQREYIKEIIQEDEKDELYDSKLEHKRRLPKDKKIEFYKSIIKENSFQYLQWYDIKEIWDLNSIVETNEYSDKQWQKVKNITIGNTNSGRLHDEWTERRDALNIRINELLKKEHEEYVKNKNSSINTQPHYKGKESLYKFAEDWQLNAWEFDAIKRLVRCRHKGQFKEDLKKTRDLLDIYEKEYKACSCGDNEVCSNC